MAYIHSHETPYGLGAPAGNHALGDRRRYFLIASWWILIALLGVLIIVFARAIFPSKFGFDGTILQEYMESQDLWQGPNFDSYINAARAWWLVSHVVPAAYLMPAYYCLLVALAIRFLGVFDVPLVRYQLFAGAWLLCSAMFLWGISKEAIAVPVALFFCLARSPGSRFLATIVFLLYAAFFRQYWAICYFYYLVVLIAFRMHIANRRLLAALVLLLGFVLPFMVANAIDFGALTEIRMTTNVGRIDSPDSRSAFVNPFENTGLATDIANALLAWAYMNFPVALLLDTVPHYFFFVAFQIWSLWFFMAGFASFLRDARQVQRSDSIHLRCAAFVIAYSLTQALFEPDFGSFLRHEIVVAVPLLILAFYRAHAARHRSSKSADTLDRTINASTSRALAALPSLSRKLRPLR